MTRLFLQLLYPAVNLFIYQAIIAACAMINESDISLRLSEAYSMEMIDSTIFVGCVVMELLLLYHVNWRKTGFTMIGELILMNLSISELHRTINSRLFCVKSSLSGDYSFKKEKTE